MLRLRTTEDPTGRVTKGKSTFLTGPQATYPCHLQGDFQRRDRPARGQPDRAKPFSTRWGIDVLQTPGQRCDLDGQMSIERADSPGVMGRANTSPASVPSHPAGGTNQARPSSCYVRRVGLVMRRMRGSFSS